MISMIKALFNWISIAIMVGVLLIVLFFTSIVNGDTLRFAWDYSETIDNFTIWERTAEGQVAALENIPPAAREATFDNAFATGQCRTYYIVANKGSISSLPSNAASWCKDTELPPMFVRPGQVINLTIEVTE